MEISNKDYLEWGNEWALRAAEHRRLAAYCDRQANIFLGKVAMPDDATPQLRLLDFEEVEE